MPRVGVGDMKKSVYDPDLDGILALAQLASTVCSETEADTKVAAEATARTNAISTHAGLATVHQNAPGLIATHAGVSGAHHARVRVAVGSYEGDDSDGRQITTGFKCGLVIVQSDYQLRRVVMVQGMSFGDSSTEHNTDRTAVAYIHATDGFIVGEAGVSINKIGQMQYYVAVEE